jgi:hypothetical protein
MPTVFTGLAPWGDMSQTLIPGFFMGIPMHDAILAAQALASGAMCGLIWFVQVVHYPLFASESAGSTGYALENQRRTAWVVVPFMLVEMAAAALIALDPPHGIGRGAAVGGVMLILAIWASTAFVQVPLHARLAREGHAADTVGSLVRGNWFRTVAWTARAVLAIWMLRIAS